MLRLYNSTAHHHLFAWVPTTSRILLKRMFALNSSPLFLLHTKSEEIARLQGVLQVSRVEIDANRGGMAVDHAMEMRKLEEWEAKKQTMIAE
ncbi:hypothetical protein JAAARDRAFT_419945 [Jaapia argillacea MUCL 33604]|uniref:Uncharacterized protein n=1 Tax=Jaapia argillacea MUCL 33604 TaxID=933084 RepID=A0A067PGS7_9AGAM|nr:hypothetical protein JAAARDRAFT_419945 [Jaapia argillacea MUCL 33604]